MHTSERLFNAVRLFYELRIYVKLATNFSFVKKFDLNNRKKKRKKNVTRPRNEIFAFLFAFSDDP